jgi:hypothetical protein
VRKTLLATRTRRAVPVWLNKRYSGLKPKAFPMPPDRPLEPWRSFLADIDRTVDHPVVLHCIGGFAMAVLFRPAMLRHTLQMPDGTLTLRLRLEMLWGD